MTKAEVAQVMGDIQAPMGIYGGYVGGGGIWYGEQHWTKGRRLKEDLSFYFGITFKVDYDDYPVNIQFERGDHVVRIKRGADIVTATAAEISATNAGHGAPRPRPMP